MMKFKHITLVIGLAFSISFKSYAIVDTKACNEASEYGIMDWIIVGGNDGDLFVVMENEYPLPEPLGRFKRYVPSKYERVKDLLTQAYLLSYSVCFDETLQQNGQSAITAIYIKAS
ncbi:hypothetical protein [Aeromonas salmonicida]|uniref:hypothetical protein n=1 Tax=Aeromonas salmonicida TaxID=645 RepID=UPI003D22D75C